ncbi:unnamed protein product [Ectocarpus sp. 13 AM-2016]
MRGSSTITLGMMFATFVYLTASSWPTAASAFVTQGPSVHRTACRHYEQRQQRRLPASDGRTTSPHSSCFLPQKQQQKTLPTTASHSGSSGVVGSDIHHRRHSRVRARSVAGCNGVADGSGERRWQTSSLPRSSSLLVMGGAGEGGGGAGAEVESGLMLFNTEGRTKERFRPQDRRQDLGRVKFYSCGPTVYDMAHIGNFRAFLTYDVLKRWLVYQGFEVDHVCNLTDVDDKIIARMARDGVSLEELTGKYAKLFFDDLESLNIVPASRYPRATEHIDDIVEMVQGLIDKELAYEVNGSVYFRVSKHGKYGTLACLDTSGMEDGAGEGGGINDAVEFESEKEDAKDFALWKGFKPEDGEVFWDTPLGKGRPGWHIECSAMARKFLGDTLDVHAGGIDLVFPHHENEVAQSEGFTGKPFCRCWVHNAFVNVDGEKMSKSKGNFLTLKSTLATALDVRAFRYLVVSSQYRTTLGFSMKSLESAKNTLRRLDKLRVRGCTLVTHKVCVLPGVGGVCVSVPALWLRRTMVGCVRDRRGRKHAVAVAVVRPAA